MLSYTAIIIEWINLSPGNAISLGPIDLNHQVTTVPGARFYRESSKTLPTWRWPTIYQELVTLGAITQWCSIEIIVEQTRAIE
jgi:hypothetical protein